MRARKLILAAAIGTAALTIPAVPVAAAAAQPSTDARAKVDKLATIIHPVELAVDAAVKAADIFFVSTLTQDPNVGQLEEAYPGVVKAMYQAARPLLIEGERRNAHIVQGKLAGLYLDEFSVAELDQLTGFYSSPVGQKVIAGMFDPAAVGGMLKEGLKNGFTEVEQGTIERTHVRSAMTMAMSLDAESQKTAAAFALTPAGKKVAGLAPKVQAIGYEVMNAKDPAYEAKVQDAMMAAMQAFMDKSAAE